MIRYASAQTGLTLLELLAALALSAVGFAIVLNAMGQATRQLTEDEQLTRMVLAGRSLLDELSLGRVAAGHWQGTRGDVHWVLTSTLVSQGPSDEVFRLELQLDNQSLHQQFTSLRIQRPARKGEQL